MSNCACLMFFFLYFCIFLCWQFFFVCAIAAWLTNEIWRLCWECVCVFTDDDGGGGAFTVWQPRQVHLLDTYRLGRYEDAALRESWVILVYATICEMCMARTTYVSLAGSFSFPQFHLFFFIFRSINQGKRLLDQWLTDRKTLRGHRVYRTSCSAFLLCPCHLIRTCSVFL